MVVEEGVAMALVGECLVEVGVGLSVEVLVVVWGFSVLSLVALLLARLALVGVPVG